MKNETNLMIYCNVMKKIQLVLKGLSKMKKNDKICSHCNFLWVVRPKLLNQPKSPKKYQPVQSLSVQYFPMLYLIIVNLETSLLLWQRSQIAEIPTTPELAEAFSWARGCNVGNPKHDCFGMLMIKVVMFEYFKWNVRLWFNECYNLINVSNWL